MSITISSFLDHEHISQPASVRSVIKARGISGDDVSPREMITPQRTGNVPQSVRRTWQNWLADHTVSAENLLPETAEEVRTALLGEIGDDGSVRATGSGHSHSAAAKPDGAFVSLGGLVAAIRDMSAAEIMTNQIEGVAAVLREHMRDIAPGTSLFEALGDLVRGRSPAEVAEAVIDEIMRSGDVDLLRQATTLDPERLREELAKRVSSGIEGLLDDGGWLKDAPAGLASDEAAVRVAAGTMLKRLNRVHLKDRHALRNMGSFDGQTLAGAINTGTHGTGTQLATMADDVLSAELACVTRSVAGEPLVRQFRIEPSDGPTDRERFEADAPSHATNLIQDDETFHAAISGYGAFGIATAYTMRVRSPYWLHEKTTLGPWSWLKARLEGPTRRVDGVGTVPEMTMNARHVSFWFNVAQIQEDDPVEDPDCMLLERSIPEPPVPDEDAEPQERTKGFWEWFGSAFQGLPVDPEDPKPLMGARTVGGNIRDGYFRPRANTQPFGNSATSASYISLRRERDGTDDPYQPPEPPPLAISMEVAVPATEVVRAMELIFDKVLESRYFFPAPIGVRFVASSAQFLAPQRDRPSAMIEVPFPISVFFGASVRAEARDRRRDEIAKEAFQPILDALRQDPLLNARPHLGKVHGVDASSLSQTFPDAERWKAVRARFDPFGTFDNAFTRELGL